MSNKDDVDMPDVIFIQWRDKTHEKEHELRGNHFRVSDSDVKYTRAGKAEPAIDVEEIQQCIRETLVKYNKSDGFCDAAINHPTENRKTFLSTVIVLELETRNLIRTPREPIEGLEEALEACQLKYTHPINIDGVKINMRALIEAAKRYHEET